MYGQPIVKDGIVLEKGIAITPDRIQDNFQLYVTWLRHWILYPDLFLDLIQRSDDKHFHLFFYQRIALRAAMRYRYHSWTNSNPYIQ